MTVGMTRRTDIMERGFLVPNGGWLTPFGCSTWTPKKLKSVLNRNGPVRKKPWFAGGMRSSVADTSNLRSQLNTRTEMVIKWLEKQGKS